MQHSIRGLINKFSKTREKAREEGSLQTKQVLISLRRDICSETISQVVICGIIASPTHKYMGVCMHYVCVSVCVWHTAVPGVSA